MEDLSLVHALGATRDLAHDHDGEVWRQLERRAAGLLDRVHVDDPDQHSGVDIRVDRSALAVEHTDAVMAALLAVAEAPDEERAAAAVDRLDLLDDGAGRDDGPTPPEPDPALTDEGW